MATQTTIANIALGHLGSARITDISESSVAAEHCRRMWDAVRDDLLRQFAWNFAIRRVTLTALSEPPAFGYSAEFPLPSDCLRPLEVNGNRAGVGLTAFSVEERSILANASSVQLRYIRRVEQVSLWDANFVQLMGFELAAAIAPSFTLQTSVVQQLLAMAEPVRMRAAEANAIETKPRVVRYSVGTDPYVAAREGWPIGSTEIDGEEWPLYVPPEGTSPGGDCGCPADIFSFDPDASTYVP